MLFDKVKKHPDIKVIENLLKGGHTPQHIHSWLKNKYPINRGIEYIPRNEKLNISEATLIFYRKAFLLKKDKKIKIKFRSSRLNEVE